MRADARWRWRYGTHWAHSWQLTSCELAEAYRRRTPPRLHPHCSTRPAPRTRVTPVSSRRFRPRARGKGEPQRPARGATRAPAAPARPCLTRPHHAHIVELACRVAAPCALPAAHRSSARVRHATLVQLPAHLPRWWPHASSVAETRHAACTLPWTTLCRVCPPPRVRSLRASAPSGPPSPEPSSLDSTPPARHGRPSPHAEAHWVRCTPPTPRQAVSK